MGFSQSFVYWTRKDTDERFFTKESLKTVSFLIGKSFFAIGNLGFKQDIGIPMGIDPAPFWASHFLYFYENKFMQQLICNKSPGPLIITLLVALLMILMKVVILKKLSRNFLYVWQNQ